MPTVLVTVAIALVAALAVLAIAVGGTRDGAAMLRDVRTAHRLRRSARKGGAAGTVAAVGAEVARPHVFADAHRDLVDAADAEDGLAEMLSWSQPEDGYLTAGELADRLRSVVHR